MRWAPTLFAGCIGIGQGGGGDTTDAEQLDPPTTGNEVSVPDPGPTGTTSPGADDPTDSPPDSAGSTPPEEWTPEDCAGSFDVPVNALPVQYNGLCCPGEVHRYVLTRNFASVGYDAEAVGCTGISVALVDRDGSVLTTSPACGGGSSPDVRAGAAVEVANEWSPNAVPYTITLTP